MGKLKLKESIYILKESEDIYSAIFTSTRKIKRFRVDSLVKKVIQELKHPREEGDLRGILGKDYVQEDIHSCINSLEKFGIVRKINPGRIDDKYRKQIEFIDELTDSWQETLELQNKIKESKVAVFGVGGIGTWIVNSLSQIGVGEIRISDPDKVNRSNLNRQLYFTEEDEGKYKVDVIKGKIKDTKIIPYKKWVSKESNLEEIISQTNFIVNCADYPSVEKTSEIIDKYANKNEIPYCVSGGYNLHLGMVGPIIIPGKTKSFNDFLKYQKENDPLTNLEKIKDIKNTGNIGPIAGAVANIQAMEIFKHLIGKGERNYDKFLEIDFMDFEIKKVEF